MGEQSKPKFLAAICVVTAAGTAGGPFVGATLSDHDVLINPIARCTLLTVI
jgi:hypothetical protein